MTIGARSGLTDWEMLNENNMGNWIKWWKSKFFLTILAIVAVTIVVTFLLAYLLEWGWIPAIALALGGGFAIRKVVIKKLDEMSEE